MLLLAESRESGRRGLPAEQCPSGLIVTLESTISSDPVNLLRTI